MENWLNDKIKSLLIPTISEFIKIPNQSREYDPEWDTNGLQEQACHFAMDFAKNLDIKGYSVEFIEEKGRTPAILAVIEPFNPNGEITEELEKTVLMYGHIDKQPPLDGLWSEGLGPLTPVIKDNKLYGRGGADDGYAWFSCALLIKALQVNNHAHNRVVLFFETDEESGSKDLLYYLEKNKSKIGESALIFCLDSGTTDYEHMCLTTSLRGYVCFEMRVDVAEVGVHSGNASGIVPSPFRILRHILNEFEDSKTGLLPEGLYVDVEADKYTQAKELIKIKEGEIDFKFPMLKGVEKMGNTGFQNYMNRIWKPQLSVVGMDGTPDGAHAGNVLLPWSSMKCSIRIPPSLDVEDAKKVVKEYFDNIEIPYNAKFTLSKLEGGSGFVCPAFSSELEEIIKKNGQSAFNEPVLFFGEGGSIPFLNDIKKVFPKAQFIVTGVLGPESNAHGPDEMLELNYLDKLVKSMAYIMRDSAGKL